MANVIKHKRGSGSDPVASDLVVGEVAIRTDVGKLFTKTDSGTVSEIAGGGSDIVLNTLSSSSGTGGGSATFNGSAYRFTLSQPPSVSAYQLLVSINGIIQKPVTGTSQPSEGFAVDGNDIILGDAPATGADYFILTFKSLGVSEPADNSVTSAKIVDGAIVNADVNASAAIAKSKIETFVNNNADNRLITGSGTANTLNGESTTFDGTNLKFSSTSTQIELQTSDGSDNGFINLSGGGACSQGRGAQVVCYGNEYSGQEGRLLLLAGQSGHANGTIDFYTSGSQKAIIDSSGNVRVITGNIRVGDDTNSNAGTQTISVGSVSSGAGGIGIFGNPTNGNSFVQFGDGTASADQYRGWMNYQHASDNLNFGTAGSERMRIDSSGRVGIGTTSPERQLHIVGNDGATGATLGNSDTCLVLDNQQGNGAIMEFLSDNDGAGRIMFTDTDASNQGKIQYFHNNDFFQMEVATSSQSTMALHLTKQNAASNVQSDMIAFDVGGSGRGKIVSAHSGSSSPQFSSYSDRRLKTNIKDYTGGYEKIKSLKIRIYDEISNDDTKSIIGDIPAKNVIGYIADEFQEVFPQEVRGTKDEIDSDGKPVYQSISDTFLTPYLVQALQEAVGKIETLETKVAALEAK